MNQYVKIGLSALLIAAVGVFGVDYFSHLLFSNPMETTTYFFAKFALFSVFSIIFLSNFNPKSNKVGTVLVAGVIVASLWGLYYNVLPLFFPYYPFGIPLYGLSFLGMGLLGTGLAFGIVHALAFIVGYYVAVRVLR